MTTADRPRVGDQITTAEQLDALPVGSVLRTRSGALAETGDMRGKPSRVVWCEGWSEHADAVEHFAPLTVLYVPGEQTHPSVDALRAEEGIEAATEAVEAEFASMNAGSDHGARDVAEAAISAYGSALAPVTPADRPSVTDNARADVLEQGIRAFIRHGQAVPADVTTYDREAVHADLLAVIDDANRAAGRAETTTATTEDVQERAELVMARVDEQQRNGEPATVTQLAQALADAGLLATARTRPTRGGDDQ